MQLQIFYRDDDSYQVFGFCQYEQDKSNLGAYSILSAKCERVGNYKGKRRYVLQLITADGTTNMIQCSNETDYTAWIYASEDAIAHALERKVEDIQFDILGLHKMIDKVQENPGLPTSAQVCFRAQFFSTWKNSRSLLRRPLGTPNLQQGTTRKGIRALGIQPDCLCVVSSHR